MIERRGGRFAVRAMLFVGTCGVVATAATAASATQTCTTGPFVDGMDVADGNGTIDWSQVAGAGISFAFMKASQGNYDTDSTFAANWSGSKAAGVTRGAYHFLDPTISGVVQAQFFLNIVGTIGSTDLPPMLDIECPTSNDEPDSDDCLGTGSSGDATGAAITQVMNDWLTTVKTATGRTPVVYSYGSYFSDDGVDTTGLPSFPLFIAYPTTSSCFDFPAPWTQATFWQYSWTGTVAGISGSVDLDYFLGSSAELTTFLASGTSPPSDAGISSDDAGVPCEVTTTGETGVCILTTTCMSMPDHVSTPGYCPGPDDIQCCTGPAVTDAGIPDATSDGGTGPVDSGSGAADATVEGGHEGGVVPPEDGGGHETFDGGGDAGAEHPKPEPAKGCSCRLSGLAQAPHEGLFVGALVLAAGAARRRRRGPRDGEPSEADERL